MQGAHRQDAELSSTPCGVVSALQVDPPPEQRIVLGERRAGELPDLGEALGGRIDTKKTFLISVLLERLLEHLRLRRETAAAADRAAPFACVSAVAADVVADVDKAVVEHN